MWDLVGVEVMPRTNTTHFRKLLATATDGEHAWTEHSFLRTLQRAGYDVGYIGDWVDTLSEKSDGPAQRARLCRAAGDDEATATVRL